MFITTTQVRVRYAETDQMGVVYYGNYAMYYEVGRVESFRHIGGSYKEMEKTGVIMPVVSYACKYLKPAVYDDLLTITTTVSQLPNHKMIFEATVHNQNGDLLNTSEVVLLFLQAKTMSKTNAPEALLALLAPYFSA